jgi:hypothetical protein
MAEVDGIHLWANLETGRSYVGILPLKEWEDAATWLLAGSFRSPPVGVLVLSYHDNGDYFLLLDTARSVYLWWDPQDPDGSEVVANGVPQLLDWWLDKASELRPPNA